MINPAAAAPLSKRRDPIIYRRYTKILENGQEEISLVDCYVGMDNGAAL
jgi:hypothetical protein